MKKTKKITLTDHQMQMMIGSLLGDGCLQKITNNKHNSRYVELHGIKQKELLEWKAKIILPIQSTVVPKYQPCPIRLQNGKIGRDNSRILTTYNMRTLVATCFTELEHEWYLRNSNGEYIFNQIGNRIKIVPTNIQLTPFSTAVWFMDDGCCRVAKREASFAVHSFNNDEQHFLCEKLKNLGINSTCKSNVIRVCSSNFIDFIEMTSSALGVIPKCMYYKFDLSHYTQPKPLASGLNRLSDGRISGWITDVHRDKIKQMDQNGIKLDVIAQQMNISLRTIYQIAEKRTLRRSNTSGICGVYKREQRWIATTRINGKRKEKSFKTIEEAIAFRNG